jgi:undecaprenyl diphosphate synthase
MTNTQKKRKRFLNSSAQADPQGISDLDPTKLPSHVAIIMDGNGRWARKRLLNRIKGHEKGADTVRTIVRVCRQLGIPYLTLYAFSTENWQRPRQEVKALMALLKRFLNAELPELIKQDIRLQAIGQLERLPEDVRRTLQSTLDATRANQGLTLNLALSYGGRDDIVQAVKQVAQRIESGELSSDAIDAASIGQHLYTATMPDPDLLIRTSGEMRVSNFLLWQIAYSEINVTPTLWPDFSADEFIAILKDYQRRDRRFGAVTSEIQTD